MNPRHDSAHKEPQDNQATPISEEDGASLDTLNELPLDEIPLDDLGTDQDSAASAASSERVLSLSDIHPNRKSVNPPKGSKLKQGMHLYDYLRLCDPPLDQKLIDIACAETQVPPSLREEAGQEIRATWLTNTPNLAFQPGQIASYAHRIARQTGLRIRRDLGSAVRIPASAFRKDGGTSHITPGLLAPSLDFGDLESWMCMERTAEASFSENALLFGSVELATDDSALDDIHRAKARLAQVQNIQHILTTRQAHVMQALILGAELTELAQELQVPLATIRNELAIVTDLLAQSASEPL